MTTQNGLKMTMERPCALVPGYHIALEYSINPFGDEKESTFYCNKAFDDGSGTICCGQTLEECHIYKSMLEMIAASRQPPQTRQSIKPILVYV